MRTAVNVAFWRHNVLSEHHISRTRVLPDVAEGAEPEPSLDEAYDGDVEPVVQVWAEKIFYTWKVLRLRRQRNALMSDVIAPKYTALCTSAPPEVPKLVNPTLYRVSGADGWCSIFNGDYEFSGKLNDRLMYQNSAGCYIYWKWRWKMKPPPSAEDQRYVFSIPGDGHAPPLGEWTMSGYVGGCWSKDLGDVIEQDMPTTAPTVSIPVEEDPEGAAGLDLWTKFMEENKDAFIEVPRQGLLQVRQGNLYLMRATLLGWKAVQTLEDYQNKELGNCVAVSGNAVEVRRTFMTALWKRSNIRLSRTQFVSGLQGMRNRAVTIRFLSAWRAWHLQHFQSREQVVVGAAVRGAIAMKGICFQAWAKSSWEFRIEMQVQEKLDALDETMMKQKEIWSLRIAELKGALQQAKRAKEAPEEQQAKSQYALRKRQFGAPAPAFFRTPRVSMESLSATMPRISRFG
jgi:hypothetical protein